MTEEFPAEFRREERDGILTVTFTRDRKLNAITPGMIEAVRGAVADMIDRDDLKVLVIAAEGRYFSAGIDISAMDPDPGRLTDGSRSGIKARTTLRKLHHLLDSLEALEKPVVHAAHAPCLGLGLELAASCDFRLAAESAAYALPEIPRLGVIAGSGGISRLTRIVGPHWTRYISLLSRSVDARKAEQIGLVHEVYPDADFVERVQAFAQELARLPSEAIGLAKLAIDAAMSSDRASARDFDRIANTVLMFGDESRRVIAHWAAKKKD